MARRLLGFLRNPSHLQYIAALTESGSGSFEDYYPLSAAGEMDTRHASLYYGRNVIWDGYTGQMVRAYPKYIQHVSGNQFDADKLAAIVSGIDEAPDRVVLTAPYGNVNFIDPLDVKESIESMRHGDDEGLDEPLSTGDDDLDEWLVDPERFDKGDQAHMKRLLKEAVRLKQGDLGKLACTIRDGNHRAFGALLAGEPYIWMIVEDNQMQDLHRKGRKTPGQRAILDELE